MVGLRFGDVRFRSNLRTGALIGRYWSMIGWITLAFVVFGAYVGGAVSLYVWLKGIPVEMLATGGKITQAVPLIIIYAVGYIALVLVTNIVIRLYLLRDIWQRVAASITVERLDAAANVTAKGELVNAIGEGIADGLDVAGF